MNLHAVRVYLAFRSPAASKPRCSVSRDEDSFVRPQKALMCVGRRAGGLRQRGPPTLCCRPAGGRSHWTGWAAVLAWCPAAGGGAERTVLAAVEVPSHCRSAAVPKPFSCLARAGRSFSRVSPTSGPPPRSRRLRRWPTSRGTSPGCPWKQFFTLTSHSFGIIIIYLYLIIFK